MVYTLRVTDANVAAERGPFPEIQPTRLPFGRKLRED